MSKKKKGDITMLTYSFMRVALVVAILLGISLPLVGAPAVFRRMSSSGDALAHSSLAGIAIGLASGFSTIWMSIISCFVSLLIIELLRKKFNKFSEIGVAVVLSSAIALAGILSSYTKSSNFDSYLFGSILLISNTELYLCIALCVAILLFSIVFYPQIFASLYSGDEARVSKIKSSWLQFGLDLLLALTIAIGSKIVGSLVVSSLIVIPVATSLILKKGYKVTIALSVLLSVVSMVGGLIAAYYLDWKPGATIVGVGVAILLLVALFKALTTFLKQKKSH